MAYPDNVTELTDGVPPNGIAAATPLGSITYPLDDWARSVATTLEAIQTQLTGAWTAYTPTITVAAPGTSPTMGTGSTAEGYYRRQGRLVQGYATIVFGTSGVAAGSGNYGLLLPVQPANRTQSIGIGYLVDTNSNIRFMVASAAVSPVFFAASTSKAIIIVSNAAGEGFSTGDNPVSDSAPWTWEANDQIILQFAYEAAAAS